MQFEIKLLRLLLLLLLLLIMIIRDGFVRGMMGHSNIL